MMIKYSTGSASINTSHTRATEQSDVITTVGATSFALLLARCSADSLSSDSNSINSLSTSRFLKVRAIGLVIHLIVKAPEQQFGLYYHFGVQGEATKC